MRPRMVGSSWDSYPTCSNRLVMVESWKVVRIEAKSVLAALQIHLACTNVGRGRIPCLPARRRRTQTLHRDIASYSASVAKISRPSVAKQPSVATHVY